MNINIVMTENEVNALLSNHPNMKPFSTITETVDGRTYKVTSYREQLSGFQRVARIIAAFAATIFTGFIGLLIPGVRNLWKEGFSGEKQMNIRILNERNQNNIPPRNELDPQRYQNNIPPRNELDPQRYQNNIPPRNELDPSVKKIEEFKKQNPHLALLDLKDEQITQRILELEQKLDQKEPIGILNLILFREIAYSRKLDRDENLLRSNVLKKFVSATFPAYFNKWLDEINKTNKDACALLTSLVPNPYSVEAIKDLASKAHLFSSIIGNIKVVLPF